MYLALAHDQAWIQYIAYGCPQEADNPVGKLKLPHENLTPEQGLKGAIKEISLHERDSYSPERLGRSTGGRKGCRTGAEKMNGPLKQEHERE